MRLDYLMTFIDGLFLLNKPMGEQLKRMVKKEFELERQEWINVCKKREPVFFAEDYPLEESRKAIRIRRLRSAEILSEMGEEEEADKIRKE